ncbi:MAG: hypothetical protein GXP36_01070 [Actinobacteria bacterium]|nr:hypothetical protein [Actinomycetota bacterium]
MTDAAIALGLNPSLSVWISIGLLVLGTILIFGTLLSAVRTVILPRGTTSMLNRIVFRVGFLGFATAARRRRTYEGRDRVMAQFGPVSLVLLGMVWLAAVASGYSLVFWATGADSLSAGAVLSGSSITTLGSAPPASGIHQALSYSEATLGLFLGALMITYLPTLYSVFSRREVQVATLEVRAGTPPSAGEFLVRYHNLGWLDRLDEVFLEWERWFAELEESHTSYPVLNFFRSPEPDRSWVTAAGTVLDAAALTRACVDVSYPKGAAAVCIRSGYLALRRLADFFGIGYEANPLPTDRIAVARSEFDEVWNALRAADVPLVADQDRAWTDYAGWRVNYESLILDFAEITMAPYAPWTSDRSSLSHQLPRITRFGAPPGESIPYSGT